MKPVLLHGECAAVTVVMDGLNSDVEYALQLTPSGGLSYPKTFTSRCNHRAQKWSPMSNSANHRLTGDICGCRTQRNQGALTAVLSRDGTSIATEEVQVVILPEPVPYPHRNVGACVLVTRSDFGETSGRTADGVAYYGTSAVYTGFMRPALIDAVFGGKAAYSECAIGAAEGRPTSITEVDLDFSVDFSITRNGKTKRAPTLSKTCTARSVQSCLAVSDYLQFSVDSTWWSLIRPTTISFNTSARHIMRSGSNRLTVHTSASC